MYRYRTQRMERILVPIASTIHPDEQVGISYAYWPAAEITTTTTTTYPTVILVHGFDSSCLEFRRFGSQLAARGIETYAVDLLGWGYTQLDNVQTFSATAKVDALESFIDVIMTTTQNNNNKKKNTLFSSSSSSSSNSYCIVGASLGGAAAMEIAVRSSTTRTSLSSSEYKNNLRSYDCCGLILIDAQGFVDGIGPMASLPTPLAQLGIQVLQSIPLRSSANQMSYYDKETYATDDAVRIGRYHILQQGEKEWSNALLSFMKSGGFRPTQYVTQITIPTLLLWGRQDSILNGKELIPQFQSAIPQAQVQWIEECGHVPHLEQPMYVAMHRI
jgi:pimeloyl-ACP methyl ester carboxylesterase